MNLLLVVALILLVRLSSVFVVQTFYVPDEFWQSLEVAHKLTFGYGYLTWEWLQGIRSYVYPLLIGGVYKALALLHLDSAELLIILPRILQALLTSYADYRFFVWTGKKKWALFLITIPWFSYYIGSRTLANTLEGALTTIALSYFPWVGEGTIYLWPAALCCFLRPTAAIIWIPLCVHHLQKSKLSFVDLVVKQYLGIGLTVAALCIGVDSFMHGKLIITPYEFIKYNIFHNIGSFYGSHPWHWYFTTGLPTVLGITTIPFLFSVSETVRHHKTQPVQKQLLITILLSLVVLSTVEHKEFRFVAGLLPLCLYITADALTRWSYKAPSFMLWFVTIVLLVGNALPAWYLSTVHQKAPINLMSHLRTIARDYRDENDQRASILYLMPCHSTPYYSHIHENVTMRFLTCEPNLQHKANYKDEADQFYASPVHWLRSHLPSYPRKALPTHVVLYEPLSVQINEFLLNYKILETIGEENIIVSETLLNKWSQLLKQKQLNVEEILQKLQKRRATKILIYQRLVAGEENEYNREEFADGRQPYNAHEADEDNILNDKSEHNLFN